MRTGLRFCPRCGTVMLTKNRGASLFLYCPRCGFEEAVSAVVKPGRRPVLKPIEATCPRCGGALTLRPSHNLTFTYCRACGYVTAAYSPPTVRLPVERRVLATWLKNAREKAAQSKVTIGRGDLVKVDMESEGDVAVLTLNVSIIRDYAESLRPLDSVFYADELSIVLDELKAKNCSGEICRGYLRLAARPKRHPPTGRLHIAEPTMLYESALRILDENRCTLHGVVAEAPRCKSPSAPKISMRKRWNLDRWQMEALERALSLPPHGFLAVEGPPGTGKTSVIAAAACEIAMAGGKALITSLTNVAVDNAIERILEFCGFEAGKYVTRIGHPAKISPTVRRYVVADLRRQRAGGLEALLREARVFGMTMAKLASLDLFYGLDKRLGGGFDYVFIDEASMVPLALAVVPLHYGVRRVVLGDSRQLPPPLGEEAEPQATAPLIEAIETLTSPVTLLRQRRGVKEIFAYLSEVFYQGMLEHGVEAAERLEIPPSGDALDSLLAPERPLVWIDAGGIQEWMRVVRGAYTSYSAYNKAEAALAVALYKRLHDAGLAGKTAIIATFRAQALLVSKAAELLRLGKPSVAYTSAEEALQLGEIEDLLDLRAASTVDSYQGREKEIVIYSVVADRYHKAIDNYARFNVAMSRAKKKLIVLSSLAQDIDQFPWLDALRKRVTPAAWPRDQTPKWAVEAVEAAAAQLTSPG